MPECPSRWGRVERCTDPGRGCTDRGTTVDLGTGGHGSTADALISTTEGAGLAELPGALVALGAHLVALGAHLVVVGEVLVAVGEVLVAVGEAGE